MDHKNRDGSSGELTSLATTDGTTLSMSASESRRGRVVKSIVTTYILVTLPCGASDLPSSTNLQTPASSISPNANATRGPGRSLTRPWKTTIVNPSVSSSLINWNSTKVSSRNSTMVSNGTTTAVNTGVLIPSSNGGVPTSKPGQSPALSSAITATANHPVSHSVSSLFSKPIQSKQPVESENTSFNASLSSPITASTQGGQSSRNAGSSTFTLQISLSEGGTDQTSRISTSPGQETTPSAGAQPVDSSPSGSTKATGNDPSLPPSSGEDVRSSTGLPQTSPSGTDRDVPTSSMPHSVPSGGSTQQHSTKASESSDSNRSKTTEATGNDDSSKTSTKKGHDDNSSGNEKSTKASPGSTKDSGISLTGAASSTGKSASPSGTADPGSSETGSLESTSSEDQDYATVFMTATIDPPPGIDPKTTVTWTSTEVTKTTTRDGSAWPTIFPVWFCGGGQLLCAPKCLIPFLSCGGIDGPGPLGFPWAKPPPRKPRGKPRKVRPDDRTDPENPEDDPEPSETPTSSSSEVSCTASTTILPHCDQHCFVNPVTKTGSSTKFTTSCNTATCKPTVVCSRTLDTTTTTTFTTHSSTPTPVEHFCGDRESPCLDCGKEKTGAKGIVARQHGFIPWNPHPDPELLNGPQGLTRPETWPQGPQNWWDRMWRYVYHYCDGLTAPRLTLDGERLEMGYSTMHADEFKDQGLAGATGPFWGCSGIVIVTKRGIYTSHVWEIPNFHKGTHNPTALDWAEEFEEGILRFLKRGSGDRVGGYVGIDQLEDSTDIFANRQEDTLAVILHVPSSMAFSGSSQIPPNYGDFDPRHAALVDRWADFIAGDLGFPRDKIHKNIYVKGPSYWPAYVEERRPLNPMDMYMPPYGLLHWQYHPAHVVETLADGTEIRKPTIRVWYEKFLIFEESWCLPGTVTARNDKGGGGGSCPMPAAPAAQSSLAASGGSGSASSSASGRGTNQLSPTSAATRNSSSTSFVPPAAFPSNSTRTSGASTNTNAPPAISSSYSSSKAKATAWVTATAEVTVTNWVDPTPSGATNKPSYVSGGPIISRVPASEATKPLPTPSYGPSKRVVRISQDMSFGVDKKTNHTAVITVYEISDAAEGGVRETILVSQRDDGGGGSPVDLPSKIMVEDQDGGRLEVRFVTAPQQIELESKRRGRVLKWAMINIKDEQNPGNPYCDVRSVTPGEGVLKRSVECFYNT
ncbi:hypothetical protein CDEST_07085 [Colletotrichum destructivum]|uniref:Uncharacterized protein n=1 Tax=Colletotrichum destructivum TaxID=34406 RepID=A0AAX4IFD3_9PEZI|nr:hypothetical protein CDEST_07085 [Colletotrichum destructivum]